MSSSLGDFIRQRRAELGLTQRQVALHLGFKSLAHLSDIESGNRNPSPEHLPKLAELLQCSLDDLKNHDVRVPLEEAKQLLTDRPEMVAAFRRVVTDARKLSPEDFAKRFGPPPSGG